MNDDTVEIVPITEQIEARVQDAVGEITGAPPEEVGEAPREPDALELAEVPPRIVEAVEEPLLTPYEVKRGLGRMVKLAVIAGVVLLAAGLVVTFTDAGRSLLPKPMQKEAKSIAREVEDRARGVEEFYTYSDEEGVVHIVDDIEKVPPKLRARAKKVR